MAESGRRGQHFTLVVGRQITHYLGQSLRWGMNSTWNFQDKRASTETVDTIFLTCGGQVIFLVVSGDNYHFVILTFILHVRKSR